MRKNIAVLGSTGSIGTQTLDVARKHPELLAVTAIACGSSIGLAEQQAREFGVKVVAVYDEKACEDLRVRLKDTDVRVLSGMDGLIEMCSLPEVDVLFRRSTLLSRPSSG